MTDLRRAGAYAFAEDLAASLHTTVGRIRQVASKRGWRKVRTGRRVRYHVEDAWQDLGDGAPGRKTRRSGEDA